MAITVQQISRRAKLIRRKGEKWIHAIKRASNELKKKYGTVGTTRKASRGSSGRKTVPRKKKSVASYKPRKPKHQTGSSSKKIDQRMRAMPPGKRIVKSGGKKHAYYEYRKNRSDMPGKLTGVKQATNNTAYMQMINGHIKEAINVIGAAERRLQHWTELKRKTHRSEKLQRRMIDNRIAEEKKFIATQKKEISMLKTLLKY